MYEEAKAEMVELEKYIDSESAIGFQKKIMHQLRFAAESMRFPIGEVKDDELNLEALLIIHAFQKLFHSAGIRWRGQ